MTNLVDFDRSLADFLADGPNTAPEAPVIAALAHARTTPRRPDLLRAFRSDVMAAPQRMALGRRPALALALLALLVAGVGVAVIGSRPTDPSIVVPGPSASGLAPSPTIGPSVAPFARSITILVSGGQPFLIDVSDTTGDLVDAVAIQPGDGATVGNDEVRIAADPADPAAMVVTWSGVACERSGFLRVDEGTHQIAIGRETCEGDLVPLDRIVRLRFNAPADATAWTGSIENLVQANPSPDASATFAASPAPVAFQFEVIDGVGQQTLLDVVDGSGHLTNAVSGQGSDGITAEVMAAANLDARTVRLSWPGSPCDTIARLTIAADVGMTLDRIACQGDAIATFRSVILTFDRDVDADAFDTALSEVDSGSEFPWSVDGADSAGGRYTMRVADGSQALLVVAGMDPAGVASPGLDRVRLDQAGASIVELVWTGRACDVTPELTIDTSGTHWLLTDVGCSGEVANVVRRVSLKFSGPRPAGSISVTLTPIIPT